MPRRALAGALLTSSLLLCAGAAADSPRDQSRAAFMRGVADAHQGHYTAARDEFLEAYNLYAHPSILMNLGIARWHTGEYIQAEKDLARFLSDDGGASDEDIANARAGLAAVRQHLGTVRMRVAPVGARVMLDTQPVTLVLSGFAEVRAVVGPNELRAEADGYETVRQSVVVSHETPVTLDLSLKPLAAAGAKHEKPSSPGEADGTRKLVAYSSIAVSAASTIAWAGFGLRALSLASAYNTKGSLEYQDPGTKSTGIAFRSAADVFFVTALLAGGVGAYLLIFPVGTDAQTTRASVVVGPGSVIFSRDF
jgi:hypothetical protein